MNTYTLHPFDKSHQAWAHAFITRTWGSTRMVSRGTLYHVLDYPGFVAICTEGTPQGIVTYRINADQCEILLLHSDREGAGIGAALVERVKEAASAAGCTRLWLVTTNDNIHAIRWYQRRGFTFAAVHVNALAQSRTLKPEIPLVGQHDIPLRDEIEFEMPLI